jgi:hypothetical protein
VNPDLTPSDHSLPLDLSPAHRVNDLVDGYLLALPQPIQADRRRDLDAWFAFCAEFNVDPLLAEPRHVAGYADYLSEVKQEAPGTVGGRLGVLSAFYSHALALGAVSGTPVPW